MLIERSHFLIGLVVGVVLLVGSVYSVTLQAGALASGDDIVIEFADAARVEAGAPVRVAGVRVGQVMGVEIVGDRVHVTVRTPEPVPADSTARITTTNALGARAITLDPGDDWEDLLGDHDDPMIPLERSEPFVDLPDVTDETVALLEDADSEAAARLFTSLADVTADQRDEVGDLLEGLEQVGGVVADNRAELETFLDDAGALVDVLNEADEDLLRTIDGLSEAVASLDAGRQELLEFVRATASTSSTTADLVEDERDRIDDVLEEVGALLALVDDHQVDLAHLIGYGGVSFEGFATVGESQGQDNPYWGDIFTTGFGAVGVDAVAGCGGLVDEVLDQLLGPGPACPEDEQSALDPVPPIGGDVLPSDAAATSSPETTTQRERAGGLEHFLGGGLLGGGR